MSKSQILTFGVTALLLVSIGIDLFYGLEGLVRITLLVGVLAMLTLASVRWVIRQIIAFVFWVIAATAGIIEDLSSWIGNSAWSVCQWLRRSREQSLEKEATTPPEVDDELGVDTLNMVH